MKNILILSSDRVFSSYLQIILEDAGFSVTVSASCSAFSYIYDAVVADTETVEPSLPECKLLCTGYAANRASGLYDFILRPFADSDIISRLKNISSEAPADGFAQLNLDMDKKRAEYAGKAVILTGREAELLSMLINNRGRVVPKSEIIDTVFGGAATGNVDAVYINYLRKKLSELFGNCNMIENIRGVGYKLLY